MAILILLGILVLAVVIIAGYIIGVYNRLIKLRNGAENAWAQIDVQLKRRYDLIPNLVETVKGYAAHEREVFQKVTEARTRAMAAGTVKEHGEAENQLAGALKSLFAVAERYPQLKASGNFVKLQEELSSTENRIASARQLYNDASMKFNVMQQVFPARLIAGAFGFAGKEYFETEEPASREPVSVKFTETQK